MSEQITKRQKAVLECIEDYIAEKGYGPAVRDVCERLGLSSPSTVFVHLNALEEKGYIKRDPLKSRSIILTNPASSGTHAIGASNYNIVELPVVGQVAAGAPILAEENITNTMSLPTEIVGDSATFMLSIHGDSMIEAGINDGDYVVVREQQTANNGDIVVALIEDGATIKRFYKEKDRIRLQPENSSMEPIIVQDCSIVGKVVAQFRRIS